MRRFNNQDGAVMLLVAMLAAVLLMMAGLAIDSAVIANSKVQQRHAAEYMGLGALKAFNEELSVDPIDKLNTATARAQQLAQENHFLAKNFLVYNTPELIGTNLLTGSHGKITPGIWYFDEGTGVCNGIDPLTGNALSDRPAPCPCDATNNANWATPCFRELNFSAGSSDLSQTPNAVRVELKTSSTSPIQTLFARVQGQETISISSAATAVQLPRRGVFLVDLSRHSHNETHISYPVASSSLPNPEYGTFGHPRFAGEYVYKPTNNCITPWTTLCPNRLSCNFNAGGTGASPTDLYTTIYNGRYRVGFSWVNYLIDDRLGAISAKTTHYKSDYVCFNTNPYVDTLPTAPLTTPTTINYPNPPADSGSSYLVDNYYGLTDTGETYDGAEPLNTMLVGINEAVKQFKENIVPSDEITVIGFDGSASIDIRTIGPLAINPLDPTFQELENLSDISLADPANGNHSDYLNSRFEKHMFFPRVHSNGDDRQKNIVEALKRAKEVLISAGNQTSENFVVLISDGLGSCVESNNPGAAPDGCDTNPTPCRICSTSYAGFMNSFTQAEKIIEEEYLPNNIKFHFLQIGLRSKPHYLQRVKQAPSGTKTCMSVEEMESADPPLDILDSTFEIPSGSNAEDEFKKITIGGSFTLASDFGRLAKKAKGKYIPIRTPCQAGVDISSTLDSECDNPTLSNGDIVDGSFSDSRGRLTCDSLGRDKRAQMRNAVQEVFNVDPYIIVD